MDTNLVIPRALGQTEVIFDFYFTDVSPEARARNIASIETSEEIQNEDVAICASVQRGLASRSYTSADFQLGVKAANISFIVCCIPISRRLSSSACSEKNFQNTFDLSGGY